MAGLVLYAVNETIAATLVILGGLVVGLVGACVRAYRVQGKRGVAAIGLGGVGEFFGDLL